MTEKKVEKKKRFLGWYFDIPLVWRVLIALVLGAVVGLIVGPDIVVIEPLGALMLRLLQMVVLPLIFFAIIVGVGGTPASKIGRIAGKILFYYIITTVFAASFGILLAHVIKPGMGANLSGVAGAEAFEAQSVPISEMFLSLIPKNAVGACRRIYLQVFLLIFSLAISFLRDSKDERIIVE